MGTDVQGPRFLYVNEAGPPELLGHRELYIEAMARADVDRHQGPIGGLHPSTEPQVPGIGGKLGTFPPEDT